MKLTERIRVFPRNWMYYVSTYIVWVTCQIQMKFYCFSHAIKKVFDHEFQSHSNPTDIAHLEIMFFAQPNLAISPPILWSAENGSHEYLTDFIHFGIWFIWSAAWIFQLKKNTSFCVVTSKFCLVQALMLTVWTVKGDHSIVSIWCCTFLWEKKVHSWFLTTRLVKITEKALKTSSGIKPNSIRQKNHKLFWIKISQSFRQNLRSVNFKRTF